MPSIEGRRRQNVLVAVMVVDDTNHGRALQAWRKIGEAYVPAVVVSELAYFLLKHGVGLEPLHVLAADPKVEFVDVTGDDVLFAIQHGDRVRGPDDFNDLLILSAALRLGYPLATFDEELAGLYRGLGGRRVIA